MIDYLEQLVKIGEFVQAAMYAEKLLLRPENTPWDLMAVYSSLCQIRCETGEFYGAQVAGELAVKMAQELKAWDYYGHSTVWLGVSYSRLRHPESALGAWYDYLAQFSHYSKATEYHVTVLFNIGLVAVSLNREEEGLRMLWRAVDAAAVKDERKSHGIRHALVDTYLRVGQLEQIPELLAKCAHYLRHNPTADSYKQSLVWHLILRVRYAMATNRPLRALSVASRGLRETSDLPALRHHFHKLRALAYEAIGDLLSAMMEGVRARSAAIESRRFDLEFEISNWLYGLMTDNPGLSEQIDTSVDFDWNL